MVHGFGHGAGFGFGLGFLNLVGMVLFFLLVVFLIKTVVRGGWRGRGPYGGGSDWRPGWWGGPPQRWGEHRDHADEAMQIARERLARGEVTPQEFEALKRGLGSPDAGSYGTSDGAVQTARARFARGEISQEEFEAVKKALLA